MHTFLNKDNGERLCLKQVLPNDPFSTMQAFLTALAPVVQPLAVDLWLAYRLGDLPYLANDAKPPHPRWHIRQSQVPTNVMISSHCHEPELSSVPELSIDQICNWLAQTLNQPSPQPDYHVTISALEAFYTRSQLYSPAMQIDRVSLQNGQHTLEVPVEKQSNQFWVYGPIENLLLYAPLFFRFAVEYGWLMVWINITWGGLWTNPDTLEHHFLKQSLHQLIEQGWQLESEILSESLLPNFNLM